MPRPNPSDQKASKNFCPRPTRSAEKHHGRQNASTEHPSKNFLPKLLSTAKLFPQKFLPLMKKFHVKLATMTYPKMWTTQRKNHPKITPTRTAFPKKRGQDVPQTLMHIAFSPYPTQTAPKFLRFPHFGHHRPNNFSLFRQKFHHPTLFPRRNSISLGHHSRFPYTIFSSDQPSSSPFHQLQTVFPQGPKTFSHHHRHISIRRQNFYPAPR